MYRTVAFMPGINHAVASRLGRRQSLTLLLALSMFVMITALPLFTPRTDPVLPIMYVVSVAIIAAEFEVAAGMMAGIVSSVALLAWATVGHPPDVDATQLAIRAVVLVGIGGVVGWIARARHRESAITRAVLDALPDPASVKDPSGRYLLANTALGKVLGVDVAEIIGRRDAHGQSSDTQQRVEEADRTVLETGEPVEFELSGDVPGIGPIAVRTMKAPVLDDAGVVVAIVTIAHDISRRVEHERELLRLASEAQAEYERATRDYAQLIRHRVANPLTIIQGAAETLRSDLGRDERTRAEFADLICAQVDRLAAIAFSPEASSIEERELDAVASADLEPIVHAIRDISHPKRRETRQAPPDDR